MSSNSMTVSFPGGKRVTASYKGFEIETDQSPKYGGEGASPEPYDLFLASLATCGGAYLAGFCGKRDIPLEGVRLSQSWERDDKGRVVGIELAIEVPEDFPERYLGALERVVSQCAVKRTIEDPPEMRVTTTVRG
jgi:putative redox protein